MERKNLVILTLATLAVMFFALFLTSKPTVLEVDPQYDTQHYVRMLDIYSTFDDEEIQNSDVYYTDEVMVFNTIPMIYHGYEMRMIEENLNGELEVVFLNRDEDKSMTFIAYGKHHEYFMINGKQYSLDDLLSGMTFYKIK